MATKTESIKEKVDRVGRLPVSKAMGMPYATLSNKLSGFCRMMPDDEKAILKGIEKVKKSQLNN